MAAFRFKSMLTSAVVLCTVIGTNNSYGFGVDDRVLLMDVSSLTLYKDQYTTGRRSSPVPQLTCVGGTAYGYYNPTVIQCYNRGTDGSDVQWECKADLDNAFRFGPVEVVCEGYDHPDDPYILKGSCGLEYTLDFTEEGLRRYKQDTWQCGNSWSSHDHCSSSDGQQSSTVSSEKKETFGCLILVVGVVVISYIVYKCCCSSKRGHRAARSDQQQHDRHHQPSSSAPSNNTDNSTETVRHRQSQRSNIYPQLPSAPPLQDTLYGSGDSENTCKDARPDHPSQHFTTDAGENVQNEKGSKNDQPPPYSPTPSAPPLYEDVNQGGGDGSEFHTNEPADQPPPYSPPSYGFQPEYTQGRDSGCSPSSSSSSNIRTASASTGSGGEGLSGILRQIFTPNTNHQQSHHRHSPQRSHHRSEAPRPVHTAPSPPPSQTSTASSGTRTASGFGGTRRR